MTCSAFAVAAYGSLFVAAVHFAVIEVSYFVVAVASSCLIQSLV